MHTKQHLSSHERLGSFLRARREQTRPEDIGLRGSSRRRTPGLRREEVAVLANVGVSWYTWLEQGRAVGVSECILEAIEDALRLSPEDRLHVRRLASARRSPESLGTLPLRGATDENPGGVEYLQQLVDAFAGPAYVSDPFWTVVAMNQAAAEVFDARVGTSCLVRFFTDPEVAGAHVNQEMIAHSLVALFRAQSAKFSDDPRFEAMARRLGAVSDVFYDLWHRQVVSDSYHADIAYNHPSLGLLNFRSVILEIPRAPAMRLFAYVPKNRAKSEMKVTPSSNLQYD